MVFKVRKTRLGSCSEPSGTHTHGVIASLMHRFGTAKASQNVIAKLRLGAQNQSASSQTCRVDTGVKLHQFQTTMRLLFDKQVTSLRDH